GGKATEFSSKAAPEPTSSIPVPPPLPPTLTQASGSASSGGLTGTAAVFAQINQGSDVTKNLKKVDKSEMTHKNPSLRASGEVGRGASTVEAGLAGAESGKDIAPPDCTTAMSSRRDVAASRLRRSDQLSPSITFEESQSYRLMIVASEFNP
ncbi:2929_t:CDS:1, partial [Acaulospora colombiana]